MSAALEGAKLGSEAGRFLGPEGGVAGALIGGAIGAAGIIGNLIHRNNAEPSTPAERRPLIRANPLTGRTVPSLRQRVVVPGRDPQDIADQAIRQAAERSRQNEIRQRVRPRIIRTQHIPRVIAGAGATATTAAATVASHASDAARVPPPQPPVVTAPTPPPQTTTPTAPTNPIPPPPIDEPPIIIDSDPESKATPEIETKEPEIPPAVITQHFKMLDRRNQRVGNFHLPIFGRHDFVEWTEYTEGNALAAQY